MSTKTTLKRIALVAVSALGFGLMSIVPSQSAELDTRNYVNGISFGDISTSSGNVGRVGVQITVPLRLSTGSSYVMAASAGASIDINAFVKFSDVPSAETTYKVVATASTSYPVLSSGAASVGSLFSAIGSPLLNTATGASGLTPPKYAIVAVGSAATGVTLKGSTANAKIGDVSFTPNATGVYKLTAWADNAAAGNNSGQLDTLERNTTKSITVGGTPTTIAVTSLNSSAAVGSAQVPGSNKGHVFQVSVKDAAGNMTGLIPGESVSVTLSAGAGTISDASLTANDFNSNGYAYVTITGEATQTGTFTFAATGFTATSQVITATGTKATSRASSFTLAQTTGLSAGSGWTEATINTLTALDDAVGRTVNFATGKAVSLTLTVGSTGTSRYAAISIVDDSGVLTGDDVGTVEYATLVSISDTTGNGSITLPTSGLAAGDSISVVMLNEDGSGGPTVTFVATTVAINANSTLSPATASIVTGGGVTLTAQCLDQFNQPVNGCAVSWSVAGRNATTVPTQTISDANGYATYTLTDTSTSTTSLVSTVSATMTYGSSTNTETASITFGAANAPSTVTVTTSPTLTVATTETAISTAATGPEAGAVLLTFTVKDANGVVIVGTPVTFTADSTNVSWKSSATSTLVRTLAYTDSTGIATTYIAGWVAPSTVTVTATAGGKTATTKINFVTNATDARTIAVTAANGIAKATVKDRFGNPVKGATVNWSRTGTGYFGSGVSATTGTTDVNGEAEILFIGDGTVKAELAVATYAQCDDAAGFVGTTATSGTGASLAPAGTCSATVAVTGSVDKATEAAQAASDAALEAIDAANAATDAANLAAEAADAATVAAEEARDAADAATAAVEALASEVATLIAGLKAQITTLANTVAKIAKRVRA